MTKENQEIYLQFVREISEGDGDLKKLTESLSGVAYYYHISAIEAELMSDERLQQKELTLFERENASPVGEPIKFVFEFKERPSIVIYIYADDRPFSGEEKEDLELYASNCCFVLQRYQMERFMRYAGERQFQTWLYNIDGYLSNIGIRIENGMKLTDYTALSFNICRFGEMNRRFGRKKGTEILTGYGTAVSRMIEKDEMIGHMGGDSFVALILRSRVKQFINSLEDIAVTVEVDGKNETVHFSAAIGAWDVNRDDIDLEELIRRPYMGMNMARKDHVSCFYVTEKMLSQMAEIKTVLEHYNEALETGEFKVFYQPKVDSKTGRLVGAEGLVRWFRGDRIISPGVFIPALEDNREIIKLDYYVLRQACLDIRSWTEKGYDVVPVSVNFSRRDLEDRDLAVNINKIIEETGIDKKYIEIELTETVDADEHGELSKFIDRLYKMGIMTAIDDFGAGYSSLATLREFSVHTLKLDRSFVNTDDFSWKDEIILRDVIHMAGELDMDILCEGVERNDQLALLNSVGCFVIQGYYYDRPLPEGEFEERLKKKVYKGV